MTAKLDSYGIKSKHPINDRTTVWLESTGGETKSKAKSSEIFWRRPNDDDAVTKAAKQSKRQGSVPRILGANVKKLHENVIDEKQRLRSKANGKRSTKNVIKDFTTRNWRLSIAKE